ncbi:MAG: hypothetical protein IPP27_11220 [Bacteroidetes bacterium]|nr:hypothetical protein [Bacteroidota bacterium]
MQEPLRSISNFSVLLKEKLQANTDPGTNRYMDKIIAAASRMSNLINDLLEYSRLGKDMERTKINTARLVDEVVHDIGIIIKESGAKITIEKLPVVVGHQSLKSLFQNLITNSIKFTAKGTRPEIKKSLQRKIKLNLFFQFLIMALVSIHNISSVFLLSFSDYIQGKIIRGQELGLHSAKKLLNCMEEGSG